MDFIITTQEEVNTQISGVGIVIFLLLALIITIASFCSGNIEIIISGVFIAILILFGSLLLPGRPQVAIETPEITSTIIQKINNQPEYSNAKEASNSSKLQLIIQLDHKNNTYSCAQKNKKILPNNKTNTTNTSSTKKTIERLFTCTMKPKTIN